MEHRGMLRPTRSSLSAVGKRCSEDNTLCLHITPPLTKPVVRHRYKFLNRSSMVLSLIARILPLCPVSTNVSCEM